MSKQRRFSICCHPECTLLTKIYHSCGPILYFLLCGLNFKQSSLLPGFHIDLIIAFKEKKKTLVMFKQKLVAGSCRMNMGDVNRPLLSL